MAIHRSATTLGTESMPYPPQPTYKVSDSTPTFHTQTSYVTPFFGIPSIPVLTHTFLVKLLLLILFVFNSPSFPFIWHIRVWWPPIKCYWEVYTKGRKKYLMDWKAANVAAGGIKGNRMRRSRVAWFDDCDYNQHLSNSSAPLNFPDLVRKQS